MARAAKALTNVEGLERTLAAMTAALEPKDEALVALARGLAAAVDADPSSAALWREYRAAVTDLSEVGGGDDLDDDAAGFLLAVRTPVRSTVGNAKKP